MADAPDTSSYILVAADPALPNSRALVAGTGFTLQDTGSSGQTITVQPVNNLLNLAEFSAPGYVNYDATNQIFTGNTFVQGTGISIDFPDGQGGNTAFSVVPNSTIQKIQVSANDLLESTRSNVNFKTAGGVSITVVDNSLDNRADVTITSPAIPNYDATYIIQTPNGSLPNAQALNEVVTGLTNYLAKVHTASGVISAAQPDVDYMSVSPQLLSIAGITPTQGTLIQGGGPEFIGSPIGPAGTVATSNGVFLIWDPPVSGVVGVVLSPGTVSVNMLPNTFYVPTSTTGLVTFHLPLPVNCVPGQIFRIKGDGSSGWRINAGIALQSIRWGSLVTTDMGHIASTSPQDSIEMVCVTPTEFTIDVLLGTPDVV